MGYEAYFKNTEEDMVKELLAHPGPGACGSIRRGLEPSGSLASTPLRTWTLGQKPENHDCEPEASQSPCRGLHLPMAGHIP